MNDFWKGYLTSCIIFSIGSLFIYAVKTNRYTFNLLEFLVADLFGCAFILSFAGLIVFIVNKKEVKHG